MRNKIARPYGLGEIFNASWNATLRTLKVIIYGWDGSAAQAIKVDTNGVVSISPSNTAVGDTTATVTNAGTRVQLSDTTCKRAFVQAHESNTGTIVVGAATCVAALVGRRGLALYPTQGEWFNVSNTNLLYIDSTASSDKVTIYYEA